MTADENRMNTWGVSESIGFLLIFSIVIVGIGLVTLYGYPMLLTQQSNADETIMEKNMIVLQNDVKGLVYKTVPYKETSLKVGGGSLTVYNSQYTPASSEITINDCGATSYVNAFHPGDLRYESLSAQSDVSLQNGAVVKKSTVETGSQGSAMLAQPRWFYDGTTKTMVVNLISINSTDIMARSGIGTVQMELGETKYLSQTGGMACMIYKPDATPGGQDYSVAWNNYFQTLGMTLTSGTPGTGNPLAYQLPVSDTLVIKQYDVVIKSV
jgi:hypothetical protein